ncbi:MAG: S-layer homology domain-containing protein, partial [Candidatus Peregrinibacteria bacterium]|nr:S-layer homology domain-containing protein [Candidatus Peregrinibacteria bacterium]
MQKIVWVFFLASFLLTPTAFADMWDNTLSDFEMFNQQLQYDSDALSVEQEAALLNESTDLFPLTEEEEESSKADNYSQSDTHVTIKVNGVPVILDDVPAFEWFASYVRDAAERGIVSGYKQANGLPSGKYGPADNVTIAQLAKMAVIAASIDTYGCLNEIQNEPATQDWSAPYIRCAENEGWAVYSDGTVDIFRPATRAEVVV